MASIADPLETPETLAARLVAATVAHKDAREVADRCAKAFRTRVVACLDAGMTQRDVAELAGVSRARLHQIIAAEYATAS